MPRAKRTTAAKPTTSAFADALRFCSLILKDHGTIGETHVCIKDNWVTAFNGVLSIGHKCDNTIQACPQIKLAIEALSKCGQAIAITKLDTNRLSIKSERFKAIIPCVAAEVIEPPMPDQPIAVIDDRLKEAFEVCGLLQTDNAQTIYGLSILLNGQSMISSLSGQMIIEYWHGIDLPAGLAIPKALITPLAKIGKKLVRIGFSPFSITIYFEDESWIKSQLYSESWASNITDIFAKKCNSQQIPQSLFEGLAAIAPFSDGLAYFTKNLVQSHENANDGAAFEVRGLEAGPIVSIRQLMLLKSFANFIDFAADDGRMTMFFGKNTRGAIANFRNDR